MDDVPPVRGFQTREARARYIAAAVAQAQYEMLPDDGGIYATVPGLQGVWAQGKTRESAQAELAGVLEGWLTLSLERRRPIPLIRGWEAL
ncbi:MAG TPA: type II toxin-antitoxin system HicB family antitoxin [Chloroflexia bacterium]